VWIDNERPLLASPACFSPRALGFQNLLPFSLKRFYEFFDHPCVERITFLLYPIVQFVAPFFVELIA
jgi:hypothetical protein